MSRAGYVVGMAAGEVMQTRNEMRQLQADTQAGVAQMRQEGQMIIGDIQLQAAAEITRGRQATQEAQQAAFVAQVEATNTRGLMVQQKAEADQLVKNLTTENSILQNELVTCCKITTG